MQARLKLGEFVAMMALMISLTALSIDAVLPALDHIREAMMVKDANHAQLVISLIFAGMAVGYLFYGPLSDSYGRKPVIFAGFMIFVLGSVLCMLASDLHHLLIGRFLQGLGLGAPRVVSMALVRDQYEGRAMARVMSFIMTVFILVPMLAPVLGQLVLLVAPWQAIFAVILLIGLISLAWFMLRQPETLMPEQRKPFSVRRISRALAEVCTHPVSLGYTLITGLIFGCFMGYLSTVQQIFQGLYQTGNAFAFWFALLAAAVGTASFLNGRWVVRLGMERLARTALVCLLVLSVGFAGIAGYFQGVPPFVFMMVYMALALFCIGFLFGNLNALAMQPVGHIAGVAAAVVTTLSNIIALPFGIGIGQLYNASVLPVVLGFAGCAGLALILMLWIQRGVQGNLDG